MESEKVSQSYPDYSNYRQIEIYKNLRCLDCPNPRSSIETSESPVAREMREIVRNLIKKEYNDVQIYRELSYIYGRHAVILIKPSDGSKIMNPFSLILNTTLITVSTIGFAVFLKKIIRRR